MSKAAHHSGLSAATSPEFGHLDDLAVGAVGVAASAARRPAARSGPSIVGRSATARHKQLARWKCDNGNHAVAWERQPRHEEDFDSDAVLGGERGAESRRGQGRPPSPRSAPLAARAPSRELRELAAWRPGAGAALAAAPRWRRAASCSGIDRTLKKVREGVEIFDEIWRRSTTHRCARPHFRLPASP